MDLVKGKGPVGADAGAAAQREKAGGEFRGFAKDVGEKKHVFWPLRPVKKLIDVAEKNPEGGAVSGGLLLTAWYLFTTAYQKLLPIATVSNEIPQAIPGYVATMAAGAAGVVTAILGVLSIAAAIAGLSEREEKKAAEKR